MSKIEHSKITRDMFIAMLNEAGGSLKDISAYIGKNDGYYYDKLLRENRLSLIDVANLEKYLTEKGLKCTFEEAYKKVMLDRKIPNPYKDNDRLRKIISWTKGELTTMLKEIRPAKMQQKVEEIIDKLGVSGE